MGRKFSKKISKKVLVQGVGLFIFFAVATTMLFQNCSQVSVSDMTLPGKEEQARILRIGAGEVTVEVGASQYDKSEASFEVGLDSVPPLKQLWILDNSNSMVYNNLNLSTSFGTMFDATNQNSLYKFDTTAYLFSTAQTIPKYSNTADRQTIVEAFGWHSAFRNLTSITDSIFDSQLRTSTENKGLLPGDNIGYSITKTANSNVTYEVEAAPVLSKKHNNTGGVILTKEINKPANTNTLNFEADFKEKLAVLVSDRIPVSTVSGLSRQQSYKVVDKESGLCAVARILDKPNGMFSPSDMLSFTIVSDENENDVNGINCLKKTGEINNLVNLVNGKCWEYETAFQFSRDTFTPKTCSFNGYDGYKAAFSYPTYTADIKYKALITKGFTIYKTPQYKVEYKTPKYDRKWRYTNVEYYTKTCTQETFKYKLKRTPVSYYTQSCVDTIYDGITQKKCTVIKTVGNLGKLSGTIFGDQTAAANCKNAAKTLGGVNTITDAINGITADYLPVCGTPVVDVDYVDESCAPVDNVNCFRATKAAAACSFPTKITGKKVKGDVRSVTSQTDCNNAAIAFAGGAANVGLPGDLNIDSTKYPKCTGAIADNQPEWELNSCSPVDNINCKDVPNGLFDTFQSAAIDGSIVTGSAACLTHSIIPSGSTGTGNCQKLVDRESTTPCTAAETAAGCVTGPVTQDDIQMKPVTNDVPGISNLAECKAWVAQQPDDKSGGLDANIDCHFDAPGTAYVYSTLKFSQVADGGNTIAKAASCGSFSTQFYNAISSSTDRAKVTSSSCAIYDFTMPSQNATRPLTAATCAAQATADCAAVGLRGCGTSVLGGGATITGVKENHGKATIKDATCSTKCNTLPNNFCESYSTSASMSVSDYFKVKYAGTGVDISCYSAASTQKSPYISDVQKLKESDKAIACPAAAAGAGVIGSPRYFVQEGSAYTYLGNVDEYVQGNVPGTNNPASDLITYIKDKIQRDNLNVNFTFFIRRTGDPVGTAGSAGTDYERFVASIGGGLAQTYAIAADSYAPALANLSSVLRSKLIRSFSIPGMQTHQVITSVTIEKPGQSVVLAIGDWSQPVGSNTITIAPNITINEGDKIVVKFQNNDGYIADQLKKIFVIDEMRPDQIIVSVEHIKKSGETVLLRTDQWVKEDNKVKIDPSVVINGGDQFRIKFKNNTTEE